MKKRKRILSVMLSVSCLLSCGIPVLADTGSQDTIITDNVVELKETISPEGFVHPGIGCSAESLSTMREMVLNGVNPWVDCFEGIRRTGYANLDAWLRLTPQIVNDGGINQFAQDAQTAWVHAILYVVTGNEEYRKKPLEVIKWYGSRSDVDFFPAYFNDSHIKLGKYVYTMCTAAEIMRYTEPKDKSLAVTDEMIDNFNKYCLKPMCDKSLAINGYFMNQHSYAIMGYLAQAILADDMDAYEEVVEWTTVNASAVNQGRNGSIKEQIRLVTENALTGEAVEPNLQVMEMGRDQPHAGGNTTNLLMMSKTIDFQNTMIDPEKGTVVSTGKQAAPANAIDVFHFLDNRLIKGAALFTKYNLGVELPWVPAYSDLIPEGMTIYDPSSAEPVTVDTAIYANLSGAQRGRLGTNGVQDAYYTFKGMGYDLDSDEYKSIKIAATSFLAGIEGGRRGGGYLATLHNYAFDYWIGLQPGAADGEPDPQKAARALKTIMDPLVLKESKGLEFEDAYVDLSMVAGDNDVYPGTKDDIPITVNSENGTDFVTMDLNGRSRSMTVHYSVGGEWGVRLRNDKPIRLSVHYGGDYTYSPAIQTVYVPANKDWNFVTLNVGADSIFYLEASPVEDTAKVDFDYISTNPEEFLPITFGESTPNAEVVTYLGQNVSGTYGASCISDTETITYTADNLPEGAVVNAATGELTWTPNESQTGTYTFAVCAHNSASVQSRETTVFVGKDLDDAITHVASAYDTSAQYVTATLKNLEDAKASRNLGAVIKAVSQLKLLNPTLKDGSLNYVETYASCSIGGWIGNLADDNGSFCSFWDAEKSVVLDFGEKFRVRADGFGVQARSGFPNRGDNVVFYGSDDGTTWIPLTEPSASTSILQYIPIFEEFKDTKFRYIRFHMLEEDRTGPGVMDLGEIRIWGERSENYDAYAHEAYIEGYEDGSFQPYENMTRAEAVSMMCKTMPLYVGRADIATTYEDVEADAWYHNTISYMQQQGCIFADPDNRFRPNEPITRAEVAAFMAAYSGLSGTPENRFSDTENHPYANAINLIAEKGWVNGYTDGTFNPDEFITRAEFVTAMNRMLKRTDANTENAKVFTDVDETHWAFKDICEASHTHSVK